MCGIVGLLYSDPRRPCPEDAIARIRDVFPYRGPDDAGLFVDGPAALGHRRLSIIDLGGGHQPMADPDDRLSIVFNGEIYNYRSLRERLISEGCAFHTDSDTEVILHLYARQGEACVQELNGMFAFGIWDRVRRTLFLARDRMGVKPLYYAESPEAFVFASEIKAVLASGVVRARCREEALTEYLVFRQVAGNETLFAGVRSLPPGCTMTVSEGRAEARRFWSRYPPAERHDEPYDDARARLAELLEESVRLRMISDVPLGTFCSGGVDSSLVTALASRIKGEPVNTFSIGFDEPDFDESRFAALVSDRYGTIHHTLKVGNQQFSDLLPRMVWHNDEPLNFANSIQIFAVSELARKHVTVVLTGEGADELFAGYPRYRIPGIVKRYRHVPGAFRQLASTLVADHRLAKLNRYAASLPDDVLLFNNSAVPPEAVAALCPGLAPPNLAVRREYLAQSDGRSLDGAGRLSLLDQETYLVSILHRQDKMSMAASIESRVPFMDYRIVELANRLSTGNKIRRGSGKAIVKDVARAFLPATVVDRRKSGFGVPLARWFQANTGLGARLVDLPGHPAADVFDGSELRRLVGEQRAGTADHSELLWAALNVCLWREAYAC